MASSSCDSYEASKRVCTEESSHVDRLGNLPLDVTYEILYRLSFKDLTCFGCVSKRCYNLRLSAPFVNFDGLRSDNNVGKMLDSFNSFMIQRGENRVEKFQFNLGDNTDDDVEKKPSNLRLDGNQNDDHDDRELPSDLPLRLSGWIDSAVRYDVEELCVKVKSPLDSTTLFSFPSDAVFGCGYLCYLYVDLKCVIGEVSSFPSMSNLTTMHLSSISVTDESFWKWVSSSCKHLETLVLVSTHGSKNIIIESPSLKTVQIFQYHGDWNLSICGNRLERIIIKWDYTPSNNSLHISAPNVKSLELYGTFSSHRKFGEMRCLNVGRIFCLGRVTELATLVDVLYRLCGVYYLKISQRILTALSKDGFTFASFKQVRRLYVACSLRDHLVPGLISLLRRTPSLKYLRLDSLPYALHSLSNLGGFEGFDMEFWKLQNLAFVIHLQTVAISLYHGSNVFEFAKYILKHARNLKRMIVYCFPNQIDDLKTLQGEMISNGTLIFHQVEAETAI